MYINYDSKIKIKQNAQGENIKMNSLKTILSVTILMSLILAVSLQADQINLDNGDQLSGKLTAIKGNKIVFITHYSTDPVAVSASKIQDIVVDGKCTLQMTNGDRISGHISALRDGELVLINEYQDKLTLPLHKIQAVNTGQKNVSGKNEKAVASGHLYPKNKSTEKEQEGAEIAADDTDEVVEGKKTPESSWEGSISAGGNRQRGNTERTSANIEVNVERLTELDEISLLFRYNYAEENSALTTRDIYGEIGYNYNLSERWYWTLNSSLLSDDFRDLDLRTTVGLGLGYRWLKSQRFSLSSEAGLTYISRNYEKSPDETDLAGRISVDVEGQITDTLSVFEKLTLYPSLEGGGHIVHNEMGLKSRITDAWHFKISHVTDYNSEPPENIEDTDTTLSLGIGYNF